MKAWTETEETTTQLFEHEGYLSRNEKLNIQTNDSEYRLILLSLLLLSPIRKANRIHLTLRMQPSNFLIPFAS